ncbi:MAG: hypothetical protein Q9193_001423 [Seirophora villosa]
MNRAHAQFHKAWKCVDISDDGKFLASCKACRSGKLYGAYYNAAAHLRRRHFAPKPTESEERVFNESGKHANDSSMSMETLKMWMQEVEVEHGLKEDRPNMENDEQDHANTTTMAQRGMPNGKGAANGANRARQDYEMQLMLLEKQNKKKLLGGSQMQEILRRPDAQPGIPGAGGFVGHAGMSPTSTRPDPSAGPGHQSKEGTLKLAPADSPGPPASLMTTGSGMQVEEVRE